MNKQYSYADEARKLVKKYSRAKFDKVEKAELEAKLIELQQMQEADRQSMGLTDNQEQFAYGGYEDDFMYLNQAPLNLKPNFNMVDSKFLNSLTPDSIGQPLNLPQFSKNSFSPTTKQSIDEENIESDLLPSYISAGASMLGNIGQMLMDKKPRQIISPSYRPEELDLSEERLAAEQQAATAGNIARRNLREGSLSTGQALSNLGALEAGIQGTRGDVLTKLGTAEKQYNIGAKNEANRMNTQMKAQDLLTNQQLADAWKQRQLAYLAGTVGVVPQAMSDINKIKQQDKYLSQLSEADRNRLKALNSWYPNYWLGQGNIPTLKK